VFIVVHVQPLLLALVLGNFWIPAITTWIFSLVAAFIINALIRHAAQRVIGATFMASGLAGLVLLFGWLPPLVFILLMFFMIKVIFSFSVDHYAVYSKPV
jgi:hypothetical protein